MSTHPDSIDDLEKWRRSSNNILWSHITQTSLDSDDVEYCETVDAIMESWEAINRVIGALARSRNGVGS